jgi:hypothetical protein
MLKYSFDLSDFNNYMGKLNRETERAVSKALDDVVETVYNLARPNVPHDTGDLLDSWTVEIRSELEILVGFDTEYAMYQHQGRRQDGTHIIRNRPAGGKSFFLKKAIDENQDLILNEIYTQTQKYLGI